MGCAPSGDIVSVVPYNVQLCPIAGCSTRSCHLLSYSVFQQGARCPVWCSLVLSHVFMLCCIIFWCVMFLLLLPVWLCNMLYISSHYLHYYCWFSYCIIYFVVLIYTQVLIIFLLSSVVLYYALLRAQLLPIRSHYVLMFGLREDSLRK